ncbi:MAG: carbohydrate kinase family protein [Erysipelotrichaceae bacterium]|nr:carbohydrate kinase family protein [Erysipelotrichaceae bacterium]
MGIVVFGAVFVDIKGYPLAQYIPGGRNVGRVVQTHGGVSRNVAEDIANVELRPTFVSVVDDSGTGIDVIEKLKKHKVNTDYIAKAPDALGTWLAVFDNNGDVTASISRRPDLSLIAEVLEKHGDEIISQCDSVVVEIDMEHELLQQIFALADKYHKEVYGVVSNMSIAVERRDLLMKIGCFVCNQQEAGQFFSEDFTQYQAEEIRSFLPAKIKSAGIRRMVITLGEWGAVYADENGESGYVPAWKVDVIDTTGAGDAFFAGVTIGLTYGKSMEEACAIGNRLAASVITTKESVCPRFQPAEFGIEIDR